MLTVSAQNKDISHGLQIGKDRKADNQRDEDGYQFNNVGFIDDISQSLLTYQRTCKSC